MNVKWPIYPRMASSCLWLTDLHTMTGTLPYVICMTFICSGLSLMYPKLKRGKCGFFFEILIFKTFYLDNYTNKGMLLLPSYGSFVLFDKKDTVNHFTRFTIGFPFSRKLTNNSIIPPIASTNVKDISYKFSIKYHHHIVVGAGGAYTQHRNDELTI